MEERKGGVPAPTLLAPTSPLPSCCMPRKSGAHLLQQQYWLIAKLSQTHATHSEHPRKTFSTYRQSNHKKYMTVFTPLHICVWQIHLFIGNLRIYGVNMHCLARKFKQRSPKQCVVKSTKKLVAEDSFGVWSCLWWHPSGGFGSVHFILIRLCGSAV